MKRKFIKKSDSDLSCSLCGKNISKGDYYYHDYLFPDMPECYECISGSAKANKLRSLANALGIVLRERARDAGLITFLEDDQ